MPSTATSTPVKSAAAPKKPARKTRARKATPKKPQVSKVTVTTFKGGKVTQKKTEFTRPSTRNLITVERYLKDIRTRWQIHQYEIQELGKDFRKGFDFVSPYHAQLVKQVKAWTVWNLTLRPERVFFIVKTRRLEFCFILLRECSNGADLWL